MSSRAKLHLSYNPAGRSHCRLQNHHVYIKHHHRGMGSSPGDVLEVFMTQALPHSPTLTSLHVRYSSFSNPSTALPTSQLILQLFRCFTYVICTSPTSQLILQPFCRFTQVTAHSTVLLLLHYIICTSPTSQLIFQPFRRFIYVAAHCPTIPLLDLRHSSFSNPSFASPTLGLLPLKSLYI